MPQTKKVYRGTKKIVLAHALQRKCSSTKKSGGRLSPVQGQKQLSLPHTAFIALDLHHRHRQQPVAAPKCCPQPLPLFFPPVPGSVVRVLNTLASAAAVVIVIIPSSSAQPSFIVNYVSQNNGEKEGEDLLPHQSQDGNLNLQGSSAFVGNETMRMQMQWPPPP